MQGGGQDKNVRFLRFLISFSHAEFFYLVLTNHYLSHTDKLYFLVFISVLCLLTSSCPLCIDLLELMSLYVYFLLFLALLMAGVL